MASLETFNPAYGSGVTVAPGVVSASSTIASGNQSLCLTNLGSVVCYVRVTAAASTATAADYPVPVGAQVTISKSTGAVIVSYVTAAGTGSLHIMHGEGM